MKWLILFKGGVETQEYFSMEMSHTFEQNGYQIYWYDLMLQEESARILMEFYNSHREDEFVAYTFNFNGIAGEKGLYPEDGTNSFWEKTGIPVFNMVVDHPLYYHKYESYLPTRYWQISIDRNHVDYLTRFSPQVAIIEDGFLPLGGTALCEQVAMPEGRKYLPISERPIDVIFTGNYTPPHTFERFLSGMDQDYIDFYHSLVTEAIENTEETIEVLAENAMKREIGEMTDQQLKMCMPNMSFIDLSVRFHYRAEVIRTLVDHGIEVDVYGAGWDLLDCEHPENLKIHGSVNSQECLDQISQAKLSINVMPWFKDGAHDRIFNSMLNGAVAVTDGSRYLRQEFTDGLDLTFYDLKRLEQLPDMVKDLLSDEDRLQQIADQAYEHCSKEHTWAHRTQSVLQWMKKVL